MPRNPSLRAAIPRDSKVHPGEVLNCNINAIFFRFFYRKCRNNGELPLKNDDFVFQNGCNSRNPPFLMRPAVKAAVVFGNVIAWLRLSELNNHMGVEWELNHMGVESYGSDGGESKDDEFCIKNEKLCIKNEEICIKNDGFCSGCRRIVTFLHF